jgi:hypothetical protein
VYKYGLHTKYVTPASVNDLETVTTLEPSDFRFISILISLFAKSIIYVAEYSVLLVQLKALVAFQSHTQYKTHLSL